MLIDDSMDTEDPLLRDSEHIHSDEEMTLHPLDDSDVPTDCEDLNRTTRLYSY